MTRRILYALAFWLCTAHAYAQAPNTVLVSQNTAKLIWTWTQGTGGPVTEFRIKCGPTPGQYATTKVITDPAARSVLVKTVVAQIGTYYCAVTAANQFGESGLSNEVGFQSGDVPGSPTAFSVSGQ